jgi:release factor glutamine methyltransferase
MTTAETLAAITGKLRPAAGDCSRAEAERILEFLLGCSRSTLYFAAPQPLPSVTDKRIEAIVERRLTEEPLAYILGAAYFFNREFTVTPDVLIPRPDTETLVEEVLLHEPPLPLRFLDLGTGSGCIAAVLAAGRPSWKGVAADVSAPALRVARRNLAGSVPLLCGDGCAPLRTAGAFDLIVCNPPYIPRAQLAALPRSVRSFEPRAALDGGIDGHDFHRYLAAAAPPLLKEGGRIYCEIGYDQRDSALRIFEAGGWRGLTVKSDLGGRPRVVRGIRPSRVNAPNH